MTNPQQPALQQHPLSAAFPSMSEVDLDNLAEDIKKHGQREPGLIFEDQILDGWHRYLACTKASVQFRSEKFDGEDPVSYVLSKNLHRRHLTASQRAAAIVAATNWRPSGVTNSRVEPGSTLTNSAMAQAAEVSEKTIQHAKLAHQAGLSEAVREGQMSAKDAARVATGKPQKKPKVVVADSKFEKLYGEVKAELVETKESLAEMRDLAASAKAFEDKAEFKEMQVLRLELRSCKRRRDELMRENTEQKKQIAYWKKKAEAK